GGGRGNVDGGVETAAQKETVQFAGAVRVEADDLACIVDAGCNRALGAQRVVASGVNAAAQQESVLAAGVVKSPHDLAGVVDAKGLGGMLGGQGIGDRGVSAAAQEKAVDTHSGPIKTHDLTRGVDAVCQGEGGGQGIVQGREGLDRHGAASSDRLGAKG